MEEEIRGRGDEGVKKKERGRREEEGKNEEVRVSRRKRLKKR